MFTCNKHAILSKCDRKQPDEKISNAGPKRLRRKILTKVNKDAILGNCDAKWCPAALKDNVGMEANLKENILTKINKAAIVKNCDAKMAAAT